MQYSGISSITLTGFPWTDREKHSSLPTWIHTPPSLSPSLSCTPIGLFPSKKIMNGCVPGHTPSMQPCGGLTPATPFCKLIFVSVCMWCAMVGYTAAVDAPVKRGNGKGQNSRRSPDRPVSSVTPTHASPSGPGHEQRKGKQLCWGLIKQNTQESWQVAELRLKLWKGEPWCCYVYLGGGGAGRLEGERMGWHIDQSCTGSVKFHELQV